MEPKSLIPILKTFYNKSPLFFCLQTIFEGSSRKATYVIAQQEENGICSRRLMILGQCWVSLGPYCCEGVCQMLANSQRTDSNFWALFVD